MDEVELFAFATTMSFEYQLDHESSNGQHGIMEFPVETKLTEFDFADTGQCFIKITDSWRGN